MYFKILDVLIIAMLIFIGYDMLKHKKSGYKILKLKNLQNVISENKKISIIDLRTPEEFKKEHVFKARNIYYYSHNFKNLMENLDKRKTYILYGGKNNVAKHVAYKFRKANFGTVYAIKGNFQKIKETGIQTK